MSFTIVKSVQISFEWQGITDSTQANWPFEGKNKLDVALRTVFSGPKIYRFAFRNDPVSIPEAYVGEAEDFCTRFGAYKCRVPEVQTGQSPHSASSLAELEDACKRLNRISGVRVSSKMINARLDGGRCELQFLKFEEFTFYRTHFNQQMLSNPFVRRAMENLAIIQTEGEGFHLMNRGRDVEMKKLSSLFKSANEKNAERFEEEMGIDQAFEPEATD